MGHIEDDGSELFLHLAWGILTFFFYSFFLSILRFCDYVWRQGDWVQIAIVWSEIRGNIYVKIWEHNWSGRVSNNKKKKTKTEQRN